MTFSFTGTITSIPFVVMANNRGDESNRKGVTANAGGSMAIEGPSGVKLP